MLRRAQIVSAIVLREAGRTCQEPSNGVLDLCGTVGRVPSRRL